MHRAARRQPQMVLESIGTSGAPEPSSDLDEPRFLDPPDGSSQRGSADLRQGRVPPCHIAVMVLAWLRTNY